MPAAGAGYQVSFNLGCASTNSLVVTPALPASFRIIPATASMTVGSGTVATKPAVTVGANGSIRTASAFSCTGTQPVTVNFQAEPGTVLGTYTAGVTVSNAADSVAVSNTALVQVVKNFIPNDNADPANSASIDNLYLGHIASAGDLDYFSVAPPAAGSTLTITLSNLPADYDLVVYGPAIPLLRAPVGTGSAPGFNSPGYGSPGFGLPGFGLPGFGLPGFGLPGFGLAQSYPATTFDDSGSTTPTSLDPDVPHLNLPLRGFSDHRSTTDESVTVHVTDSDTTPFLIQVSGYNGTSNAKPYVLRVSATPPPGNGTCAARSFAYQGTAGSLPSSPLPAGTQTLILVDQQRLGQIYGNVTLPDGTSGDAGTVIAGELQRLAAQPSVQGVAVPVEGDGAVSSAYGAWDQQPCNVAAANQVVASINAVVDRLRTGLPNLKNVVVVGNDEVVPFGRVEDHATSFNEKAPALGSVPPGGADARLPAGRGGSSGLPPLGRSLW